MTFALRARKSSGFEIVWGPATGQWVWVWGIAITVNDLREPDAGKPPVRFDEGRRLCAFYSSREGGATHWATQSGFIDHSASGQDCGIGNRPKTLSVSCSECLASDVVPYERLYWCIDGVTHCEIHGTPLLELCAECQEPQPRYASRSDIVRCVHCGNPRTKRIVCCAAEEPDSYNVWGARQVGLLLAAADEGLLIRSNIDVRTHNLRVSSELPEIGGITKLAIALHLGRTTTCGWQTQGRKMALDLALRWSWLVGVDLPGLFSGKIKPEELSIRPLPDSLDMPRKRIAPKRPSVPLDSSALYLAYWACQVFWGSSLHPCGISRRTQGQHCYTNSSSLAINKIIRSPNCFPEFLRRDAPEWR